MKIAIDIDGTLSEYPVFFYTLGTLFSQAGHEVYLITGRSKESAEDKLHRICTENGFLQNFFVRLITTAEYNNKEIQLACAVINNEKGYNEVLVATWKQRMCRELGINILFDDKADIHRLINKRGVPVFTVPKNRSGVE